MTDLIPRDILFHHLQDMGTASFDNNFWTLDYRSGYNSLITALNNESLKKLEAMKVFFDSKTEFENKFCHSLRDTYKAREGEFVVYDKNGQHEDEDKLISSFTCSIKVLEEMYHEARDRKRYALALLNDIMLPLNQFINIYRQNIQIDQTEMLANIGKFEASKKAYLTAKNTYLQTARELNKFSHEKIAESLTLFENFDKERKLKLLDREPLNYSIDQDLQLSRAELIEVLKALILRSKIDVVKRFLKKSITRVVATGDEITTYLVNSIAIPKIDSIAKAEIFGQFLIEKDFLHNLNNKMQGFANISEWRYEWTLKAYDLCNMKPPFEVPLTANGTIDPYNPAPPVMRARSPTPESEDSGIYSSTTSLVRKVATVATTATEITRSARPSAETAEQYSYIKELKFKCDDLENAYMSATIQLDELRSELEKSLFRSLHLLNSLEVERLVLSKRFIDRFVELTYKSTPEHPNPYKNYNSTSFFRDDGSFKPLHESLVQLKKATEAIDITDDLNNFVEMHRTGGYFARVETFEPFEGKKVIQLFGTDLSTVVRLADRPAPAFIVNIITSIDTLVSDDLKGTRWWNGLVIDYATVYNVRQELNSLLRSDSAFFNPVGGVMKKEDRKRFETKVSQL
ncbi:unnamed protein product [Ambrosiozyma monospora]|uniref:Unnamed protein product n=1 Tax=Ambrosiozyma monospora TaxID=43982 RepID=A0ACB5SZE8_AMBMO|nr:unnamed protein product [Ambrosiozyma monospora]